MSSLKADFDELRERVRQGRDLANAGFEPVYYLVFPPSAIIEAKRQTPAWVARLKQDGWQVAEFSAAQAIEEILEADPRHAIWQSADQRAALAWARTNLSLSNAVTGPKGLLPRLEAQLAALDGKQNHLLLVTDLEALHPYVRIGCHCSPVNPWAVCRSAWRPSATSTAAALPSCGWMTLRAGGPVF